ncbi:uncharacterized protein LOC113362969 [Ctenocephalides felis]|uniref:uncharacterized protein LOC113362969 n=1 Tax=Ctenocephalides felis TaxID=7515 RepID=UPI000E6E14BE|nr:uncharacterized protein LOC113362969 [Ctenocephalides felis]
MNLKLAAILFVGALVASAAGKPSTRAESCSKDNCKAPDCRCLSKEAPNGLSKAETPQFVMFTFDDAVNVQNIVYYDQIFAKRVNKLNGCPVAGTFFISHEYCDYELTHKLYKAGHEIALHSISHISSTEYWKNIKVEDLVKEFQGEKDIIAKFAQINKTDIQGLRLPFLQMSGNNSYEMMPKAGLVYDSSWPTQNMDNPPIWPYTLDYLQPAQDCPIGPCPNKPHKGVWVMPMVNWRDEDGVPCAMVDSCLKYPTDDADKLKNFMIKNFEKHYNTSKAPFGFYVHAAWFNVNPLYLEAYIKFIDYLQTKNDVILTNKAKVIEWIKNPVPLSQLKDSQWSKTCHKPSALGCTGQTCKVVRKDINEDRYMRICGGKCPDVYPWLGNPTGQLKNV